MTEAEWVDCRDPRPMLDYLRKDMSGRKLRLLAVAYCRNIQHLVEEYEECLQAVDSAELFADGAVDAAALEEIAWEAANVAANIDQNTELGDCLSPRHAADAIEGVAQASISLEDLWTKQRMTFFGYVIQAHANARADEIRREAWKWDKKPPEVRQQLLQQADELYRQDLERTLALQATILRDIFGNPFRPVAFDPSWRTATVAAIAQAIYDERRFADLPVLADALEEAGCDHADILEHCRGGGEHVRGCWVVDLALAKK